MANHITFNWLTKVFLFKTKPLNNKTYLFILDGYRSHHNIEFLSEYKTNNI